MPNEAMLPIVLFGLFAVFAVLMWFANMSMDQGRITDEVQRRGGRIVSINWAPFGKGWFGEKNDRIYEVVYYDREGNQRWATCKTSMFSGVFWSEDRVAYRKTPLFDSLPEQNASGKPLIQFLPSQDEPADEPEVSSSTANPRQLEDEIARLKARLVELEQRRSRLG